MSDYIEDRIKRLEVMSGAYETKISALKKRLDGIERHFNPLVARVNDLEEKHEALEDGVRNIYTRLCSMEKDVETLKIGVKENNTAVIKSMNEVCRLKCEVRGTEYIDPLTDKPVDQSTEEFVKVVRCEDCKWKGQPKCPMTFSASGYGGYDVRLIDPACDDDYCSKGERR